MEKLNLDRAKEKTLVRTDEEANTLYNILNRITMDDNFSPKEQRLANDMTNRLAYLFGLTDEND